MSFKAMAWAWDLEGLSCTKKLVLMGLANCTNDHTGVCFPSIDYLATKTGMDRKTVIKATAGLEKAGLITKVSSVGRCNEYRLNTDLTSTKIGTLT